MTDEAREVARQMRQTADEIARAGHNGWGNVCIMAAEHIEARYTAGIRVGLEMAAEECDRLAEWADQAAEKIIDEWVNVEGISAEDKKANRQDALEHRAMVKPFRMAAAKLRAKIEREAGD